MRRSVYGVQLIENMKEYLLGLDSEPRYILPPVDANRSTKAVADWWTSRWVMARIHREETLSAIERHTLIHPITHGARVELPNDELWQERLF
jgi:hypothetical protein